MMKESIQIILKVFGLILNYNEKRKWSLKENLDIWLTEYEFKKRFLINAEDHEVIEKFIEIMKIILNI